MHVHCTYQHVMINVLNDELCTADHVLLCVCLYCSYQHVMIISLDNKLCTAGHFLLCETFVLNNIL